MSDSATPWTAAHQAPLSFPISQSLLKLMSIESVMPSSHLILCCPLPLLPSVLLSIRVFSSESALHISGQSIGASASSSVLPTNIQDWFPLGLTGFISLQSKVLSEVFSNTTTQKHQFLWDILLCSYIGMFLCTCAISLMLIKWVGNIPLLQCFGRACIEITLSIL